MTKQDCVKEMQYDLDRNRGAFVYSQRFGVNSWHKHVEEALDHATLMNAAYGDEYLVLDLSIMGRIG